MSALFLRPLICSNSPVRQVKGRGSRPCLDVTFGDHTVLEEPASTSVVSAAGYAQRFRCIGPACEDTCCQGWKIPIDETALDRYQGLPDSPLKSQIVAAIAPAPRPSFSPASSPGSASDPDTPATIGAAGPQPILRLKDDGHCALLTSERLCSIHEQLGEEFLPAVCASYPRIQRQLGPVTETALALSCPEAARVVLLGPSLLSPWLLSSSLFDSAQSPQPVSSDAGSNAPAYYAEIRSTILALIGARNLQMWQRLFLVCLLCHRLDSIEAGRLRADNPDYLATFRTGANSGALVPQMESMPFDPQAQLDAVLRLAGLMLHRSRVTPRFAECVAAFTSGIGNGPSANLATLTAAYTTAYRQWFAPFERRHPHIFENYLINLVALQRFPFGRPSDPPSPGSGKAREFTRLIAQLALTRGLLIGVAGHLRESFSPGHVVHTVQAMSRHFDHHPEFLLRAQGLLAESRLDGIAGLSILLRNTLPGQPQPASDLIPAAIAAQQVGKSSSAPK
jgi:lysine-N-methylase